MKNLLSSPRFLAALSGIALLTLASVAHADHVRGIRVTVTNADASDNSVEVDVTAYFLGAPADTEETYGFRTLDWGEGEVMDSESIREVGNPAGVGAVGNYAVYRGSFSHTYSSPGPFTIRAVSFCCGGLFENLAESGGYVGNPLPAEFFPFPLETYAGYFSNTALVEFQQSVLEIPTASTVGLGLLSLALAGAGFWLIRR